jgi:uracil-DNA glycosylase family 4
MLGCGLGMKSGVEALQDKIIQCGACPRLRAHCTHMAQVKRRSYAEETYWGKPITGFGDPRARLLIVGLAPAAHGANRTGRIFTGDRSGDWLFRALHRAGFANQPSSLSRDDGLKLRDTYVTCVVKCAPPDNKPNPTELKRCISWLDRELKELSRVRVVLALGQIALQGVWPKISPPGTARPKFGHGLSYPLEGGRHLLLSYHPSQQNTFTGRLTEPMFDSVFARARELIG